MSSSSSEQTIPRRKASFLSTSSDSDKEEITEKHSDPNIFELKKFKKVSKESPSKFVQTSVSSKKMREDKHLEIKKLKSSSSKHSKPSKPFHSSSEQSKGESRGTLMLFLIIITMLKRI